MSPDLKIGETLFLLQILGTNPELKEKFIEMLIYTARYRHQTLIPSKPVALSFPKGRMVFLIRVERSF